MRNRRGALAKRYGLSRATVTKWRVRITPSDAPMGSTVPRSTVLSAAEEAVIVEFRRRTMLPLDDDTATALLRRPHLGHQVQQEQHLPVG